jgi:hypothetical protein
MCVFPQEKSVLPHDKSPDRMIDRGVIIVTLIDRELEKMFWRCGHRRVIQADTARSFHRPSSMPIKIRQI